VACAAAAAAVLVVMHAAGKRLSIIYLNETSNCLQAGSKQQQAVPQGSTDQQLASLELMLYFAHRAGQMPAHWGA
jgi:hypothetical protein